MIVNKSLFFSQNIMFVEPEPPVDGDAFIFTIDTTLGTGQNFKLPLNGVGTNDFTVDWGDGNSDTIKTTPGIYPNKTHTYDSDGIYNITINGLCTKWGGSYHSDNIKITDILCWGNLGFVDMYFAFVRCYNLTGMTDTSGTWCRNVTDMTGIFMEATTFNQDISSWNISNVTNMSSMFYSSSFNQDIGSWDVNNVTDMSSMFNSSSFNQDISSWNISGVTNMTSMFNNSLFNQDISAWNFSGVTQMNFMFRDGNLSTINYDKLLISWSNSNSLKYLVKMEVGMTKYSIAAQSAKDFLINNWYWTFVDGGLEII